MQKRTLIAGLGVAAALVFASTTGAVASGLIGSKDIKNDSVRSIDVKDGTLRVKDLRPHAVQVLKGHDGKNGVDGVDGKDGRDGKDGTNAHVHPAAGAGYADWPTANPHHDLWAPHSYGETVQVCKAGEVITGGGYSSFGGFDGDNSKDLGGNNKDVTITVSAPYIASDAAYDPISTTDSRFHADRWVVRGFNNSDAPVDVRAWALCAAN
jgi:hypothetical protein